MSKTEKFRKDYMPPDFKASETHLTFQIFDDHTRVISKTNYIRQNNQAANIFLNGTHQDLISVAVNGKTLSANDYSKTDDGINIPLTTDATVEIISDIHPEKNTSLEGLYQSNGMYCTQCEAEAFRKITYFIDRPDNMCLFTTRIEADKKSNPILLSNGNMIENGDLDHGRHFAVWHDPFPKPCYLFALVAGDLEFIRDSFTTFKGLIVDLKIFARKNEIDQCAWAMESLKQSMAWDETVYGRDYQHKQFNIVAVSDFNFGAMENTSLNIFNSACVLAKPETATDRDFMAIQAIIAHEYFHNWSGNRVTCRDWFQLSLKEGLTVFRDQEFTADHHSATVQRIDCVAQLRARQFVEDAGPLAHPIRPDSYIEMNNFYTATVYEKGAEVIRMMRTIIGNENYRKATDLYFDRHDGQAVTCDDFVQCMADATGHDFTQFKLWYAQAGTPHVTIESHYDEATKSLQIKAEQHIPDTPNQTNKHPMVIPLAANLIAKNGATILPQDKLFILREASETFTIENVPQDTILSILRGFSAPIILNNKTQTDDDLYHLAMHDSDGFNRWDSAQKIYAKIINSFMDEGAKTLPQKFTNFINHILDEVIKPSADLALLSRILTPPDYTALTLGKNNITPAPVVIAGQCLNALIYQAFSDKILKLIDIFSDLTTYSPDSSSMARRAIKRALIKFASIEDSNHSLFYNLYQNANNMTDRMIIVNAVIDGNSDMRQKILSEFYETYKNYPLVIDKWFSAQAMATRPEIFEDINKLAAHPDFVMTNPNRVRSLYGVFFNNNPKYFHDANGNGYKVFETLIPTLDAINPQTAARLLTSISAWRTLNPSLQAKIRETLDKILSHKNLSPNVREIGEKLLKG